MLHQIGPSYIRDGVRMAQGRTPEGPAPGGSAKWCGDEPVRLGAPLTPGWQELTASCARHDGARGHHMGMSVAIQATGLVKRFGSTVALAGVDVAARAGSVLGLLGPNGAGKTTIVRILATLVRADAGTASVGGFDVAT